MAVAVLTTLAYEPATRRQALDLLEPGGVPGRERWSIAAREGVADERTWREATALLELAAEGMRRLPAGFLPEEAHREATAYLERYTRSRRCPADDGRERFERGTEDVSAWT